MRLDVERWLHSHSSHEKMFEAFHLVDLYLMQHILQLVSLRSGRLLAQILEHFLGVLLGLPADVRVLDSSL